MKTTLKNHKLTLLAVVAVMGMGLIPVKTFAITATAEPKSTKCTCQNSKTKARVSLTANSQEECGAYQGKPIPGTNGATYDNCRWLAEFIVAPADILDGLVE